MFYIKHPLMYKLMRAHSFVFFALIPLCVHSLEKECEYTSKNEQVQLRHIEGKGIGYDRGYTTIQAFFTPHIDRLVPIFDVRGHVFDDGKFAANAGLGLRYFHSRVYGINAYYDYRQTHLFHYNQVAIGCESLGKKFDFRINGYFPVGRKQSFFPHFRSNIIGLARKCRS